MNDATHHSGMYNSISTIVFAISPWLLFETRLLLETQLVFETRLLLEEIRYTMSQKRNG